MSHPPEGALALRYELLERWSHRPSAEVYRARDRLSGDLVAIKVLRGVEAPARAALRREAAALRLAR